MTSDSFSNFKKTIMWLQNHRLQSYLAIFTIIIALYFLITPNIRQRRINKLTDNLSQKYNLYIGYEDPTLFFIPGVDQLPDGEKKISKKNWGSTGFKPLNKRMTIVVLKDILNALSIYPPDLVKKHLRAIFIAGEITESGMPVDSKRGFDRFYIAAPENYMEYGSDYFQKLTHSGLNYILVFWNSFPEEKWLHANPPNFIYLDTIDQTKGLNDSDATDLKNFKNNQSITELYTSGFLSNSGILQFPSDTEDYAAMIFTEPTKLLKLTHKYPPIANKAKIMIDFYSKIAPGMCNYFKSTKFPAEYCQ